MGDAASAVAVHVFVVGLVGAGGDVVGPVLMVKIPLHGFLDALLELQ